MNVSLNILTICDNQYHERIKKVFEDSKIDFRLSNMHGFEDFIDSKDPIPHVVILGPEIPLKIFLTLNSLVSEFPGLPAIVTVKKVNFKKELLSELILNGATGVVSEDIPESMIQHIIRISLDAGIIRSDFHKTYNYKVLQYIIDNYESLLSVINDNEKYEVVNEAFSKRFGKRKDELIGKSPSELWGEEIFNTKIRESLKRCQNGEIVRYKAYFDISGITGNCYEVIYRPFNYNSGRQRLSIVETKDITEIEKIRKEVEENRHRNYYFEKFLPIGVFECTKEGDIISYNDTFRSILEFEEGDLPNLKTFFTSDYRFTDYLKSVSEGENSTFSQLKLESARGSDIYTRISSHARNDESKRIIVNATLEDQTREVLLERKLSMTHRMETLGNLAGGIAHDFNTILTTIAGYTELTKQEAKDNSNIVEYMTKLEIAISKAESVINQMLTFSRQISHQKVLVKIETVFSEAMKFVRTALPYNMYLEEEISSIEGLIMADPTELFRVFLNITTNSIQAMGPKGGTIKVSLRESMINQQKFAEVIIADTGPGIEKSIIDRIYEPFFTTKETGKGTGMGLSVAHGIITELGGDITIESEPGKGAAFTIGIPVFSENDIDVTGNLEIGKTIIYADDNIYFSRTLSIALESLGYKVILASEFKYVEKRLSSQSTNADFCFIRSDLIENIGKIGFEKFFNNISGSKIIIILKLGSPVYNDLLREFRSNVVIIHEPVNLREILNVIHDNS